VARDRASIRLDIWADADWRDLDDVQQFLYFQLLSHPTLSYAGVADWRPGRIAMFSKNGSAADVRVRAEALQARGFVLIDDESEEILIRSFIKHDGILKQPKLAVSMANAYAAIASRKIREVVAFEVQKQYEKHPELSCWGAKQVRTILEAKASGIESFTPAFTPDVTPAVTPSGGQPQGVHTTTATSTSTSSIDEGGRGKRATRIPEPFIVNQKMRDWARDEVPGVDVDRSTRMFVDHWRAATGQNSSKRDWVAAWRNWLRKDYGNLSPQQRQVSRPPKQTEGCNHRFVGGYCAECSEREP
jgi:hypothetical protein